jgi:outer membrane protein W
MAIEEGDIIVRVGATSVQPHESSSVIRLRRRKKPADPIAKSSAESAR